MVKESANQKDIYTGEEKDLLTECIMCPRNCSINRLQGETGYCGIDAGIHIASVCTHRGEEPLIGGHKGICNIFFSGCNMRCIYCQNHEISHPSNCRNLISSDLEVILDQIEKVLLTGVKSVGFVSPSHVIPQVKAIIRGLKKRNLNPVTVYNTNCFDKKSIIESLDGLIDIYLPDYKYATGRISESYSDTYDYPEVAFRAIREMYYQKGSTLNVEDGFAVSGLIIRHLVLPGHAEESINVLRSIAEELSPGVHISLMSQYRPVHLVNDHPHIGRSVYSSEYKSVVQEMERLGFRNGWIQEMNSFKVYNPDFTKDHPFE